jgi:lysophospholipase L1-like esterase
VLLIGDSITKPDSSGVAEVDWWSSQVAERLGHDYEVENLGAGGTTLLMWHGALYEDQALPRQPADYVNILLGTNDSSGWPSDPTSVDLYGSRLYELLDRIFDDGAGTVILTTPPRRRFGAPEAHARIAGYREKLIAACEAMEDVLCGPDLHELLEPDEHLLPDGIHLNVSGHDIMADALFETITIPEPGPGLLHISSVGVLAALARRRRGAAPPSNARG